MKYLKKFKLFETGEWSKEVNWQFVKDNPDNDSIEANWIKSFEKQLQTIIDNLDNPKIFKIINIRGIDTYQGPCATVKIFNKTYKVWPIQDENLPLEYIWIENFPIDNTSKDDKLPGYQDYTFGIADLLNDINRSGDIKTYLTVKKFNI